MFAGSRSGRHVEASRRGFGRRWAAPGLLAVAALSLGGAATNAAWNSQVVVEAQVATGTLDINVNGNQGTAASPYVIPLPAGKFEPGLSKTVSLEVRNTGSIDAVLSGSTAVGTSGLAAQLNAKVTSGSAVLFDGKLDKLTLSGVDLKGGQNKALTLVISAPANLAASFQGKSDTAKLTLTAVQELLS